MKVKPINKLSYGILSLLSTQPMSGYDLTLKINKFWRSTHSAIYPLLSEMEGKGYIEFILKEQSGKPDKKIYSLTSEGEKLLHDWFIADTGDEVVRDEMILKLYCIKCVDTEAAEKVLDELASRYKKQIKRHIGQTEMIKSMGREHPEATPPSLFGSYILTQKVLNEAILDLQWCEWLRKQYEKKDFGLFDEDFIMGSETVGEEFVKD